MTALATFSSASPITMNHATATQAWPRSALALHIGSRSIRPSSLSFATRTDAPPRHTFFFPAEEYHPEHLEDLRELTEAGYGEVEIHLHHDNDTSEGLKTTLETFIHQLRGHGHLGTDADGRPAFGFVHGNWCLDNSLPDGQWCGVNDELRVLAACGCYADFTLPAAPSPAQTHTINSIYYATDDPHRPKSHDRGKPVQAGTPGEGDLMVIQGPLGWRWPGHRLMGMTPILESSNIGYASPPSPNRIAAWIRTHVSVTSRPEWIFIKTHTHGCDKRNTPVLLGDPMVGLHAELARRYNDGEQYKLHYVTGREMYNIIKAAESGLTGNPGDYRDFAIAPPSGKAVGIGIADQRDMKQ